ncbi:uncharacterized protein LOC119440105 isoform X1 [Dermacentor silvarum]|uniref:uncharacterized protein LOC119440105 isoform X1 n=2 Tax=Dermacentor silvarum TaxID=543639 RepID=UPI002100AE71|nr:uncharacterized protein LOC119440105 isoform X1 [Dermacentor silvarum]
MDGNYSCFTHFSFEDSSSWQPNRDSRVCSKHFVNGEKSTIESHPGYVPTIFPTVYKKRSTSSTAQLARFNRWKQRYSGSSASLATPASADSPGPASPYTAETGAIGTSSLATVDLATSTDLLYERSSTEGLDLLSTVAAELCTAVKSVETQTEERSVSSKNFSVFMCFISESGTSTQVTHLETCDNSVQHKPEVSSRHSGSDHRTSYFSGYDSIAKSANALQDLCSVSKEVFAMLLSMLPPSERKCDVTAENRLLLFLLKLKLGISYSSLAILFSVSETSASRHFKSVLKTLAVATKQWIFRPPSRVIQATMPDSFKVHYPSCTMIIDCTEIRTEQPPTVQQERVLYSNYKGAYTLKFLVAVTPGGMICFCSKAYGGRLSDAHITVDSGFLDLVQPGDTVLADKGFPGIQTVLGNQNAVLVMPPFLHASQFTPEEVRDTYNIAQVRIHVERMIQRIKIYNVLNNKVPTELIPCMTDVFHVCCVLANLQLPIIKRKEQQQSFVVSAS